MSLSVISNFTFDPQLASEHASATLIENMNLLDEALGVRMYPTNSFRCIDDGSGLVDISYFARASSLVARRDWGDIATTSYQDVTDSDGKAVILRRFLLVSFTEASVTGSLSIEQKVGQQIGRMAAKEIRERLLQIAVATLDSMPENVNDVYVSSGSPKNLELCMGGSYDRSLTTMVCHSDASGDLLLKDNAGNYKVENVGKFTIVTGLSQALGMRLAIVNDPSLKTDPGNNAFIKYHTLLLGSGVLGLMYHHKLRIKAERCILDVPTWRVRADLCFSPHLFGMKWIGTSNPDNVNLGTASNWDRCNDRQVLCVKLVHNATDLARKT